MKSIPQFERLTHYLFRYPAKFHPPIVQSLLRCYTQVGQTVLDPFVGSGTLPIEALVLGRNVSALDIDPIAVAVTTAKIGRYRPINLERSAIAVLDRVLRHRRPDSEYCHRMFVDISISSYREQSKKLSAYIPDITNIEHWFRRYVIIDLARILRAIEKSHIPESHRHLFKIVFASIIRNASNADPVPISGLEVTSHMKARDEEGRVIDPFTLFDIAMRKAVAAAKEFRAATSPSAVVSVRQGDATKIDNYVGSGIDAVITSPPYQGAVDYYRRHTLEMYWLKHAQSQQERLRLRNRYLGRLGVSLKDPLLEQSLSTSLAQMWEARIADVSPRRARDFRHYMNGMTRVLQGLSRVLRPGSPAIFVVGHSTWNGSEIPTSKLYQEIAGKLFTLDETLSYPLKNRYMSYTRHNGADIKEEHVLVLRRTRA